MLGDLQRRKASHYFSLIDEDGNGLVEANDFERRADRMADARDVSDPDARAALRKRVMNWWEHLCALADLDDDDRVTREEWQTYWEALDASVDTDENASNETLQSLERAARGTFQAMKTSDADHVTEDEYTAWLAAWGIEAQASAFDRLDRDGTGVLSEDDLVKAVKEFYLSNDPDAPGNVLYGELPV
jgi:Ca2+-binding EF-hand superfamily protein